MLQIYGFTVFVRFLSIWEVYHTLIGHISKYWAKQSKIVRSTGTFMVASLNMPLLFLWIHCRQSIWLLFDLCLSSEHQTFKLKKFSHLTICGKKIYSLSLSNKKLWPSLLKRCKCPQLAKKVLIFMNAFL